MCAVHILCKDIPETHCTWCGNMLIWCESTFKLMRVLTSEEVDDNCYESQETTFFSGCHKLTSAMKLRPEK